MHNETRSAAEWRPDYPSTYLIRIVVINQKLKLYNGSCACIPAGDAGRRNKVQIKNEYK